MVRAIESVDQLQPGDMVELEHDRYADPECPGVGCVFRTQNAEVAEKPEYEDAGASVRVVFHTDTGDGNAEPDCLERHVVVFPRHHELNIV